MSKKKLILLIICGFLTVCLIVFAVHIVYMRLYGDILSDISFSPSYTDRNGQLLQSFLTEDDKYRVFRPLSDYSSSFLELLLLQEDRYFYNHLGINPVALFKAGWETYIKKSRRMGASTITMQTAKLKYNLYTKNISGKLTQIAKAVYLELCFPKQKILEAYVNLAPCGGNIEGFETASWYYFGKSIRNLSLSEQIMLCVLPQDPIDRAPSKNNTPRELIEARKILFNAWVEKHSEDADKILYMDMKINTICTMPNKARHFTEMVKLQDETSKKKERKASEERKIVVTTLSDSIQSKCETIFFDYINQNKTLGVNNGALLLIDWKDMEIIANIGSADYYNNAIEGQVNATISKRSPGSTLKPFIYALAIEEGLIHYRTMLKDTPITFNEYSPDNYESVFKGPVQAWFALSDSRNIPAITLNRDLQKRDLYDFLSASGVTGLKEKDHYGLSIVLGTADVTMLELAKLYALLANNGLLKEVYAVKEPKKDTGKRMLNAESSFIVRKMLEANIPPYQHIPQEAKDIPIGYKTGTSIGFKDSWSVGIFDRYVLCIWIGNFDGHGNNAFLGRKMAAPLLFSIAYSMLSEITHPALNQADNPPPNVKLVPVCAVSGALASDDCPRTELSWFIPGVSPITTCKIHRKIYVDERTGYRTDEKDKPYVKSVVREFWPSDIQSLFALAGLPRLIPPDYPPEEYRFDYEKQGYPPEILSPLAGTDYVFRTNDTSRNMILLKASGDADTKELLWFANSAFLGRTRPGESMEWRPEPGVYEITVTDLKGRSSSLIASIIML